MSKIYFSGSIRGGTQKQVLYRKIIAALKKQGHQVLSEHIFSDTIRTEPLRDDEIFERDIQWIMDADCVIADVTLPSLGVGYEIAHAVLKAFIPVYCIAENTANVSAMITGNPRLTGGYYTSDEDAVDLVLSWMNRFYELDKRNTE